MTWTEIAGFVTGAVSVWLYVRQNAWAWPVGIANAVFWFVLFWSTRLYLDAGLQIVYVCFGLVGWYWWLRGGQQHGRLPVTRTRRGEALVLLVVGVLGTLGLWRVMVAVGDALPFLDAATTVLSLIAQYMLTRKLLGTWWCWIAVDVAYIGMYSSQHLYLTAALQPLFIAMCVLGIRQWRSALAEPAPAAGQLPVAVAT